MDSMADETKLAHIQERRKFLDVLCAYTHRIEAAGTESRKIFFLSTAEKYVQTAASKLIKIATELSRYKNNETRRCHD